MTENILRSSLVNEDDIDPSLNRSLEELIATLSIREQQLIQEMFITLQTKLGEKIQENLILQAKINDFRETENDNPKNIDKKLKTEIEKTIAAAEGLKYIYTNYK